MKKICLFLVFTSIILESCVGHTADDLVSIEIEDDIVNLVSYKDIKPIISNNCISCHTNPPQNGALMSLETYFDVRNAVLNRGLLDRISKPEGDPNLMPVGGPRLPQSTIDFIFQWNEDGLLEN